MLEKGRRARANKNVSFTSAGARRRGRQKTTWKDSCKRDMESVGLKEDVLERTKWRNDIHSITILSMMMGKARGEKEEPGMHVRA